MESKYQRGKIYKVWNKGFNKCYIGSTCEELSRRMASHRQSYKRWLKTGQTHYKICDLFEEFGMENCFIELIENHPCSSRDELLLREGHHQRENECINTLVAGRTPTQYREDNKAKIQEQKREYYEQNKDLFLTKAREYAENNKDKVNEAKRQYYQNNKDRINEKHKEYVIKNAEQVQADKKHWYETNKDKIQQQKSKLIKCECGSNITNNHKAKHLKTLKHQSYINQMKQQEPIIAP